MSKFPLLEILRRQIAEQYNRDTMPYVQEIKRVAQQRDGLRTILSTLTTEVGNRQLDIAMRQICAAAVDKVCLAVKHRSKSFNVHFSADELWGFNPDSIRKKLIDAWRMECLPKLRFSMDRHHEQDRMVTIVTHRYTIPELHLNHAQIEEI